MLAASRFWATEPVAASPRLAYGPGSRTTVLTDGLTAVNQIFETIGVSRAAAGY